MSDKLVGIPETLLIALWARAAASQENNPIIYDEKAIEMVSQIDYDFSRFGDSKMTKLGVAVRTTLLDKVLGDFLGKHPDTVVVNFGAGLDTRHTRMKCDNIDWFEIDVPESIKFRRRFFSETPHYHFIDQSMFDLSWTDKIKAKERNVLFLAEGLFMYFNESELKPFFCELAGRFPGSQMFFEMLAPLAVGKSKRHETVRKIDSSAEFKWGLKNSFNMQKWHPAIKIAEEWEYFDYHKKHWGLLGKIARLPIIRSYLACRIVHLLFEDIEHRW